MIVVRRSRTNSSIRPVNRIKHVTDKQGATALGVVDIQSIAVAVDNPTQAVTAQVAIGSKINGIYLRVEVVNTGVTGVLANAYFMIVKNPGFNLTFPDPNVVGANDNKKYVMHQEMVMLNMTDNGNPRTLFNGVVVIPRGYRRMGPNDTIDVHIFSPGVELSFCTQAHYKEFR